MTGPAFLIFKQGMHWNIIYNKCGFDSSKVTVSIYKAYDTNHSEEKMINIAKEQIDSGNPVIFMGLNADLTPAFLDGDAMIEWGHAMIGYDTFINSEGKQDIRLHLGYNWSNPTTSIRTTDYTHFNSIIWLEINEENLPHQCTNAYHDEDTNVDVCACQVYYNTHPNHKHTLFKEHYSYNNNNSHMSVCICGNEKANPHIVSNVVNKHGVCISCGASVYVGNGPVITPWGSNDGISDACAVNNNIQYITQNGSYILPNGVIILSERDYTLYLSQKIDLNELIYSDCCTQ